MIVYCMIDWLIYWLIDWFAPSAEGAKVEDEPGYDDDDADDDDHDYDNVDNTFV